MKSTAYMPGAGRWLHVVAATLIPVAALVSSVRAESPHLKMGNPSKATTKQANKDNFLMEKDYFALSYNSSKGIPNWVSWRLTKTDLGDAERVEFYPDETLPDGFTRIMPTDYAGSGFDRGHMCPHSDRTANDDMSKATFVMTNIIPQSPNVNQKAWNQLELYCRELVEHQHKKLYIVSGGCGQGGKGKEGAKDALADGKVVVPAKCWKVIIVLNAGSGDDLKKVKDDTRLIAVIMPNDMRVGYEWASYRVPVKKVEDLTGYAFFDQIPHEVIDSLKEKVDDESIPPPVIPDRGK